MRLTTEERSYDKYISEQLQGDSNVDIFAPLKKVNAPVFKKSGNAKRINSNGKIYELKGCVDLFTKCLMVSSSRYIDMPEIVGEFELSSITRNFMKAVGEFNSSGENWEELVHVICKFVPNSIVKDIEEVNMFIIDTM